MMFMKGFSPAGLFISDLQVVCDLEDAGHAVGAKTSNPLVSLVDDTADEGHVPF